MSEPTNPDVTTDGQVADGKADGQQTLGWRAELPDSLKQHEVFTAYKTKNELWNGHIDAVTKLKEAEGKLSNSIPKLAPDAKPEDVQAYREATGVPAKADEYEVELPEGSTTELADWFKDVAFKAGMPKDMAKAISREWNSFVEKVDKAMAENAEKAIADRINTLKTSWGPDFNKNAETVKAAFTAFKDVEGLQELLTVKVGGTAEQPVLLGDHPAIMQVFLEIGKKILPDTIVPGSQQTGTIPGNQFLFSYPDMKT